MRLTSRLKKILLPSLVALYASGTAVWLLQFFFLGDGGGGSFVPEPSPARFWWLQFHSVVSLWFLVLFGYLFHAHVEPSWRRRRHLKSGLFLTVPLVVLAATVPFLFYATDESIKSRVALFHTYLGLFVLAPFLVHYLISLAAQFREREMKSKQRRD